MSQKKLKNYFMRAITPRKYANVVEAVNCARFLLKISGNVVYEVKSLPGNKIASTFSPTGFMMYLLGLSGYLYCTYVTYYEDQTILRMLYNTKLQRYGDDFEKFFSVIFVALTMLLTPFRLINNQTLMQKIVDLDVVIGKTGHIIDYNRSAKTATIVALGQVIVYFTRLVCLYIVLSTSITMPVAKMFHVCYSDALALVTTSLYCNLLLTLIERFKWINKTMNEIKDRSSWPYTVFVRGQVPENVTKIEELQERQICEKIKTCARVYSMLFDSCNLTSRLFGLSLLFTMLHYFNYIILYLFYIMEANAAGLFHDMKRYLDFMVFTFWEIAIAVGVIFLIVAFSELTVNQAKITSVIIHEVINEDISPSINDEALKFSIQLLHEMPVFTVCGLFNLDYQYLEQGARSVTTYLVILLQFVTNTK